MPTLPPVFRAVIDKVRKHSMVESVTIKYNVIRVKFKDGIKESWALRPGPRWWRKQHVPSSNWFKSDIAVANQYESSLFDDKWNESIKPHFTVDRKSIINSGFCDIRLKIHSIILSLLEEGWIDVTHPDRTILADFEKVKKANKKAHILSIHWVRHKSHLTIPPGYIIITQCTKWGDIGSPTLREAWKDPTILYSAIDSLVKKRKTITRENITRRIIVTDHGGVKFANPCFYAALLETFFGLKKPTVLDVAPDIGSKAIGVKSIGGKYYYIDNNQLFAKSMSKYIGDLLVDNGSKVDIVILNDIYDRTLDWQKTLDIYRKRGKITIAFVRRENISQVMADKIKRCTIRPGGFDYLAVYY